MPEVTEARLAGDETVRARLLAAAIGLFARKGFAATTVREIVEDAGVTKPALYYYFGSKEGIFQEMMRGALSTFEATVADVLKMKGSASRRVLSFLDSVHALVLAHLDVMRVVDSLYYGPSQGAPSFDFEVVHTRFMETLTGLVREGMEAGEFRPGDVEDVAWALVGPFEVARGMSLCHPEMDFGRERLARLVRVVLKGISATYTEECE
jgi:AcrR family transcriptional regulator